MKTHIKSITRKDIAKAIRRYRLQAGFTPEALSRGMKREFNIHLSEGQIADAESGNYSISATVLYRIAGTLGVPVEKFFGCE